MLEKLRKDIDQNCQRITQITSLPDLEQLRLELFGKKGLLTQALKQVGKLPLEERRSTGQALHELQMHIIGIIASKKQMLEEQGIEKKLQDTQIDISLPSRGMSLGALHPMVITRAQLEDLFIQAGFEVKTGPEIEEDALNFTALNIPKNHPARALHDTFYLKDRPNLLLRTHTSTVQIRALKDNAPPFRIISTGAVYRCDSDTTHTPMFHQLEGMVINKTANFSELKGLLIKFLQTFFENPSLVTRFRASYFPFTEPSAEVDIQCVFCQGKGCGVCSHSGWLEVLGCGMVHPNVLCNAGLDTEVYQGYAFGIGIERLALLRYHIPDLRLLFKNDIRLLNQFR
jgi:phenylalanyl-tRNA synthetase alpha chain